MKRIKIQKKHSLLIWSVICVIAFIGNCFLLEEYIREKDRFRIYMRIIMGAAFAISGVGSFRKYKREISNERMREQHETLMKSLADKTN